MKINWELERTKNFLESKGYKFEYQLGSISYTCYVYTSKVSGKRVEIWDDRSGMLSVVDVQNKSIDLESL